MDFRKEDDLDAAPMHRPINPTRIMLRSERDVMNTLALRSHTAPCHFDCLRHVYLVGMMLLIAHTTYADDVWLHYGPLTRHEGVTPLDLWRSTDILGNARILASLPGIECESYFYSPFGTRTIRDAAGNEIPSSAYGAPFGFGSRPLVKYLNVLDFHHRLYNTRNGSFLTRDPLHYIDTHNERQYAMHNPIDLTDYHGLMSQGGQTTAQGAGTGAPVIPPTGNPTGNGESPNGADICVNGGATNVPWIMQGVQLQSPEEYEKSLREKLDELIEQHGEDIITAHENGALVPWARPPEYVIWLLNGDRPAFQAATSTQSQADLAKALINGRKPRPHEPGGWAFNALGPNGAAYELIAVFAGVTAAPRVFRGATSAATANLPRALIPSRPTRLRPTASREPAFQVPRPTLTIANATGGGKRELTKNQILRELNDGIFRPTILREYALHVSEVASIAQGMIVVKMNRSRIVPEDNVLIISRQIIQEVDQLTNNALLVTLRNAWLARNQVHSLRDAGLTPFWKAPDRSMQADVVYEALFRPNQPARPGVYEWTINVLPGFDY